MLVEKYYQYLLINWAKSKFCKYLLFSKDPRTSVNCSPQTKMILKRLNHRILIMATYYKITFEVFPHPMSRFLFSENEFTTNTLPLTYSQDPGSHIHTKRACLQRTGPEFITRPNLSRSNYLFENWNWKTKELEIENQ